MASTLRWKIAQSTEKKWWQNYLKNKDVPTYINWKKKYWTTFLQSIEQHLPELNTATILDIGCGPAGLFINLQSNQVTAVDPLIHTYEKDLQHFKKEWYPNTTFINSSIESYLPKIQYDVIFCINAINHVQNITQCYQQLYSWLKPGGILVISIDAHNYDVLKTIFKTLPGDVLHPHQYNIAEYNAFLTINGFSIQDTQLHKKEFIFNYYVQVAKKAAE